MSLPHPSVLVPPENEILVRQVSEIVKAIAPLLDGASKPDKTWVPLPLAQNWATYSQSPLAKRRLISGILAIQGEIGTAGGVSQAKALAAGNIPPTAFVTLPSQICQLPWKPTAGYALPALPVYYFSNDKVAHLGSALVAIDSSGVLSLVQIIGTGDTKIACQWISLNVTVI